MKINKQLPNIDFTDAKFESDEEDHYEKIPNYPQSFIQKKSDEIQHVHKLHKYQQNHPPKYIPKQHQQKRPQSAKQQQEIHKSNIPRKQKNILVSPLNRSPFKKNNKNVQFHPIYFSSTTPVISTTQPRKYNQDQISHSGVPVQGQTQQPSNEKSKLKQKNEFEQFKELGILDWEEDEDFDERFYIKNVTAHVKQQNVTPVSQNDSTERQNRVAFLNKFKTTPNKPPKPTNDLNVIIKQQEEQIELKMNNLKAQMSYKDIISNNLVISAVPPEDNYENEQFEQPEPEVDEYANEQFDPEDQQQQQQQQQQQKQQQQQQQQKQQQQQQKINIQPRRQIKETYQPRNKQQHQEELIEIKKQLEQHLLANNPQFSKIYQQYQDTQDKEHTMVDIQQKRQEQLVSAQSTLDQLREKCNQQAAIIDELKKKEHYAAQIIGVLKETKEKHKSNYEKELEKCFACKIIVRFLRYRRDRKLFQEYKQQKLMARLF